MSVRKCNPHIAGKFPGKKCIPFSGLFNFNAFIFKRDYTRENFFCLGKRVQETLKAGGFLFV